MKPQLTPRSVEFRQRREHEWRELEALVDRVLKRGLTSLSDLELEQLPRLYRSALASLSVARQTTLDRALVDYLEALASRAYLAVYGTRRTHRGALMKALLHDFPHRVRAMARPMALSFGLFTLGVIVSWALVARDAGWFFAFVNPALAGGRDPSAPTEFLRATLYQAQTGDALTGFASFLFVHNARIGLLAAALGFAAGVPTALLVFSNGLMLGAFMQLYASRGLLLPLLGWLSPHGVPEIGAVILCGAVGLQLGSSVVMPGRRTVRSALTLAGRRSAVVVMVSVGLFAVAGAIEGVFRQAVTDDGARTALAVFNVLWVSAWLLLGGRGRRAPAEEDPR